MTSADVTAEAPVLLRLKGIVKTFPGVRALDGVDLEVVAGEVHCLLGQNGAGKSTLIKVLAGVHRPDSGSLLWHGQETSFSGPQAATRAGIATIYQELDLVDDLTVAENIFLGHEQSAGGFIRRGRMRAEATAVLHRLGHGDIPVNRKVGRLPAAAKQIVSMGRALSHDAQLLVMDEPSAVLAHDEVANLFRVIRELTGRGIAVIYISHRLEEIREIGDRVTVLKDGRTSAVNLPARTTKTDDLVTRMTGRKIEYLFPERNGGAERVEERPGPALLEVVGLTRPGEFADVSLSVRAGEIVGIAGLVGSGRSELLETIYGARKSVSGEVRLDGRRLAPGRVSSAVRAGLGLAPEERKSQALLLDDRIYRNVTLATFSQYASVGFTRASSERAAATAIADALSLQPRNVARAVKTLSGGNQQKVVLGRWLVDPTGPTAHTERRLRSSGTRLLLLDEPTRGVDVGARADLYRVIRRLADDGMGVLMVSSEVPEVLGLADRLLVMREGRIVREAPAGELDEESVLDLVMAGSLLEVESP
ncbi:MAG: ribose transport system ATP-binding protein [Actinomycetota bacterium]|jgi:ribose transport system ATP-binding protein|nr:ribose transport system ATP-binding protein [Actinomycetota bacterium]MEA2973578.1 ribose transport system ATP-binding protein [Actinomycetota bacterium]